MIQNTRKNLVVGGGNQFIIWGMSIISTSIVMVILNLFTDNTICSFIWFLIPIIGYVYNRKNRYKEKVFTHIDNILKFVWIICGLFCVLTPVIICILYYFNSSIEMLFSIIPFIELLIVSIGVSISGLVLKTKYIVISGFWGLVVSFITFIDAPYIIPMTYMIWATICLIVPGIFLKIKKIC